MALSLRLGLRDRFMGLAPWQAHGEHRTFAELALHRHIATHHARELAREGKAEPRAAECDFDLTTRLHGSLSQVRLAVLGRLTTRLFHSIKVH